LRDTLAALDRLYRQAESETLAEGHSILGVNYRVAGIGKVERATGGVHTEQIFDYGVFQRTISDSQAEAISLITAYKTGAFKKTGLRRRWGDTDITIYSMAIQQLAVSIAWE